MSAAPSLGRSGSGLGSLLLLLVLWCLVDPVSSSFPRTPKPWATLASSVTTATTSEHSSSLELTRSRDDDEEMPLASARTADHDVYDGTSSASSTSISAASATAAATKTTERKNLTDSWWPLWWGGMDRKNSTEASSTGKKGDNDDDRKKKKTKKKRKRRDKRTDESEEEDSQDSTSNKSDKKQKHRNKKSRTEKEEPSDSTAQNTTSTAQTSSSSSNSTTAPKQPPPGQFIIVGPPRSPPGATGVPPSPYHNHRPPMSPQQQQQQMATLAIAELVGTLLSSLTRLWILIWGTRYIANRQESIQPTQHFVFERLNDRYMRDTMALQTALDEPPMGISKHRWRLVMARRKPRQLFSFLPINRPASLEKTFEKTIIVIEYGSTNKGELELKYLADLVSFLIASHQAQEFGSTSETLATTDPTTGATKTLVLHKPVPLEIVLKINSPGGSVAAFGLAAAQIKRLRQTEGITTTVCVDMVAASGGYMIASQADKMVAAPFATVGSVGVIYEMLNYHDVLRQYGIQPVVVKAGTQKNPVGIFGPISKQDLEIEQDRLEKVHQEFQQFTMEGRPQLKGKEAQVFDGSVYLGAEAVANRLVDDIMTSDEYLQQQIKAGHRVLKIHRSHQSRMGPHARRLSPMDILPHLKGRIEQWISSAQSPDVAARLVQWAGVIGFVRHLILSSSNNGFGKPPPY